ncbi:hypothetical protein D9Q98_008514 [Chlorella vulgaris]|uniref:CBM20 domain-containing protein n=1 Tax=Chlorella vulgaris TaxID=3077 RepID=A0A9D4YTY7_CHLVU|nr:hypothetical protein D9Q98_008514 [Chlorella vulgaris]
MPAAAAAAATPVALTVEGCTLQHGEQLRLAGSSEELGGWSFTAALQLAAASNTNGTASWAAELSLAPGRHQCKLVVVGPDGSLQWEGGRHRTLIIPRLPVPAASQGPAGAAPARLQVTCRFGETASTALTRAPKKVKAAADLEAMASRAATLMQRKQQLTSRVTQLERDVRSSHERLTSKRATVAGHLESAQIARSKLKGLLDAQLALEPPAASAASSAASAPQSTASAAPLAAVPTPAALVPAAAAAAEGMAPTTILDGGVAASHGPSAAALAAPPDVAPASAPSSAVTGTAHFATRVESVASGSRQQKDERAVARGDGAVLHLLPDGATFFRFNTDAKQPSAAELAWQRLAAQLPAQAAAGLAARVGRMQQLSGETYVSKSGSAGASMPVGSLPAAAQANAVGSFPAAGARWLKVKQAEMQGQATAHTARSKSLDVTQRGSLPVAAAWLVGQSVLGSAASLWPMLGGPSLAPSALRLCAASAERLASGLNAAAAALRSN